MQDKTVIRVPSYEDQLDRLSRFSSLSILDRVYSAERIYRDLVIDPTRLLEQASLLPGLVVYWGQEAAKARRYKAQVDGAYRQWRDQAFLEAKNVEEGLKAPSDTVAEKLYRTRPEYGEWQRRTDEAQQAAELAESLYEAFKIKVQLVKTAEQICSAEAGGAYIVVEEPRQRVSRMPVTGG